MSLALALTSIACADASLRADHAFTAGLAEVTDVRVRVAPRALGATAVVRGVLPDRCTRIDRVEQSRLGHRFELAITTRRDFGAVCDPEATPFERRVDLSFARLEPGLYTLVANGVDAAFQVSADPFGL